MLPAERALGYRDIAFSHNLGRTLPLDYASENDAGWDHRFRFEGIAGRVSSSVRYIAPRAGVTAVTGKQQVGDARHERESSL